VGPSVYVETSVISYLVGRLNQRDLVSAAHQQITREWWETRRQDFELFTSAVVVEEAARGGAGIASARIEVVSSLRFADVTPVRAISPRACCATPACRAKPTPMHCTSRSPL
jgi:hypothetical protein